MAKVSIVIPSFNSGEFLKEAIESALNQTVKCEIIVVNDGSTDNTAEIASQFDIIYLEQKNAGLSSARNTGIKHATGEFILCLDADDLIDPTFVEKTLAKMTDGVGAVRTWFKFFGDKEDEFRLSGEVTIGSLRKANAMVATTLTRKSIWEELGGFDEQMKDGYEDWEYWLRLVTAGYTVETVGETLFHYRKHGQSMITNTEKKFNEIVSYIHKKNPPKKKILFIDDLTVPGKVNGVTYYRMLVPARALEDKGYEVIFNAALAAKDKDGKLSIVGDDIEWADVIVFPRYFESSPNIIVGVMNYAKSLGKKVIYETDDYLRRIPEHNPVKDVVNVQSTQYLVDFLEKNADEKTVTTRKLQELIGGKICPNSIDYRDWEGIENAKTDKLIVGWSGGHTHRKDLEMIIPVLKKLKKKYKFEVVFRGYDVITDLYHKHYPWVSMDKYNESLASIGIDIGIAPLINDEFNQYKSNIKWLEYSLLGIPTVATNLPPYEEIKNGETGYLANTIDEWEEMLSSLLESESLRKKIGQQAKEYVKDNYDIKKNIVKWEEAYE